MKRDKHLHEGRRFAEVRKQWNRLHGSRLVTLALCLSHLAGPGGLSAAPIRQEQVVKVVETWVRHETADVRADAEVERIDPYQQNGVTMAYVVHLKNGGYCLAGADSLVLPVYFYCPKGVYDPKDPNSGAILREIAARQTFLQQDALAGGAVQKARQAEMSSRARQWEDLAAGKWTADGSAKPLGGPAPRGGSSGPTSMVLPVTSQWNQSPPFDDFCPTLPPGSTPSGSDLTVVGCVATATAQLMYYWRWPGSGVGSGSTTYNYSRTSTPLTTSLADKPNIPSDFKQHLSWANGVLTINGWWDGSMYSEAQQFTNSSGFSANVPAYEAALTSLYNRLTSYQYTTSASYTTPLNWDAMQDTYPNADTVPVNAAESQVASLCYELGVAVSMDYGVSESSSFASDIPGVVVNNFHYDPNATDTGMDSNQLVDEIQWLRPCLVGGNDHCWMIYGYNMGTSPWQFKMNMGWGGSSDGWYTLDNVDVPELTLPTDITDFVWDLAPLDVVGFVGSGGSGNGSPNSPYQNLTEAAAKAPNNATLIFDAGSANTLSSYPLTINRPFTLKGYQATVK